MIFYLLSCDAPALNRMTLGAIRSHLSTMNVALLMAVSTILSDVREYRFYVAGDALNLFMHAAKGIIGFVVVKLRHSANGSPTCRCVTVLTGYC